MSNTKSNFFNPQKGRGSTRASKRVGNVAALVRSLRDEFAKFKEWADGDVEARITESLEARLTVNFDKALENWLDGDAGTAVLDGLKGRLTVEYGDPSPVASSSPVVRHDGVSGEYALEAVAGSSHALSLSGNATILPLEDGAENETAAIRLYISPNTNSLTFPDSVRWVGRKAPNMSKTKGAVDIVEFLWVSGIGWVGNFVGRC